jgi:nucleoside-diphosphate-sugar epimerase
VVTGASSGIGEAIARALAGRGWQVVLLARREDLLRSLAGELEGEYEVCDVGKRDEVERVAAAVQGRHPRIDLLVNSAGIPGRAGFAAIDPERLEEVLRVNYLGAVWCLRAFLPALESTGRADVVNIVSVAGAVAFALAGPYAASTRSIPASSRQRGFRRRPRCGARSCAGSWSDQTMSPVTYSRPSTATGARPSCRAGIGWRRWRKRSRRGSWHGSRHARATGPNGRSPKGWGQTPAFGDTCRECDDVSTRRA